MLYIVYPCFLVNQMQPTSNWTGECANVTLVSHTFNYHLMVASYIAIYAINETQIYTSGVYTNYYRGYKYPSSCPTNRYGPACLYECNCEPEYCHIVLGCTDTNHTKPPALLNLWVQCCLSLFLWIQEFRDLSTQHHWGDNSQANVVNVSNSTKAIKSHYGFHDVFMTTNDQAE